MQDIIKLASVDGGKFFVMDEGGEVKLVVLSIDDYVELMEGKLARKLKSTAEEVEKINKEIVRAQLEETPVAPPVPHPASPTFTVTDRPPRVDLREEVLDPSFDFEGPKIEIDDL